MRKINVVSPWISSCRVLSFAEEYFKDESNNEGMITLCASWTQKR